MLNTNNLSHSINESFYLKNNIIHILHVGWNEQKETWMVL